MTWKEQAIISTGTQLLGPNDTTQAFTAGVGPLMANGRPMFGYQRAGQGAAGYVEQSLGDFPGFHDLVDPTTPRRNRGFELRDSIINVIAAGACNYAWGIHDLITPFDWTSLVGLGFEHGPDFILKTFLKDAPASALPPRVLRQIVTPYLANVLHELAIIVDGWTKTITWTVDGNVVDIFQPFQPVDQTGGTAAQVMLAYRYRGLVPAAGSMSIYRYGGGVSSPILTLREFP